jgi:hypothetical protein
VQHEPCEIVHSSVSDGAQQQSCDIVAAVASEAGCVAYEQAAKVGVTFVTRTSSSVSSNRAKLIRKIIDHDESHGST